jgi:F-type H+-transporting ATPase subunit a
MPEIGEAVSYHLGVPVPALMSWVTVLVLLVLSFFATRRMRVIPRGVQAGFEIALRFVFDQADDIVGEESRKFYPLFLGLFLFILTGNLLGLVPGFSSPTANLNTTVALALVVFFSTHAFGIRKHGFFGYLAKFSAGVPWWLKPLMTVIELISEIARPLSLSFRLFGNLMAKEILLGILAFLAVTFFQAGGVINTTLGIVPILLRPLIILLGLLVGFLQAYIFTVLAMFYIGGAIKSHS